MSDDTLRPVDVTAELGRDAKGYQRVYRTPRGSLVKVYTRPLGEALPGQHGFEMTGALCDDAGSARRDDAGAPIVIDGPFGAQRAVLTLWAHDAPEFAAQLEPLRLAYVTRVERIALARLQPLPPGVGVKPPV